jgi:hypothetical protein
MEAEVVRVSSDPWVRRLLFAAIFCFVLVLVLFVSFKVTLSSGASTLNAVASETRS